MTRDRVISRSRCTVCGAPLHRLADGIARDADAKPHFQKDRPVSLFDAPVIVDVKSEQV